MLAIIGLISKAVVSARQEAGLSPELLEDAASIPVESGVFERSAYALDYSNMPEGETSLAEYYQRRAYPGAPPTIPHPLLSEQGIGGKTCLQCHEHGGYVPRFQAFAPVTPHPQLLSCRQCHVPQTSRELFKPIDWEKIAPPPLHQAALPGAPPVIPHGLHMRENCLACHAGPAAPKEIRVSHPERINCRQCHVSAQGNEHFQRPLNPGVLPEAHQPTPLGEEQLTQIHHWLKSKTN